MTVLNYIISILALAVLIYETYLVIRQNRRVTVKGKDDFFTFCLVLLFTSLLLRPDPDAELVESLRNTLILMAMFFTLAVKRGVNDSGVVKLGFIVPWKKVDMVEIAEYQSSKVVARFTAGKRQYKLIFPKYQLKQLVYEIQKHIPKVMVENTLKLNG